MSKFKDFINGFRKLDYTVDLVSDPYDNLCLSFDCIKKVSEEAAKLPIKNINVRLLNCEIIKNPKIYNTFSNHLFNDGSCDHYIKVSKQRYETRAYTEYVVETITHFLAIDNNIWSCNTSVMITGGTVNSEYDHQITNIGIDICNHIMLDVFKIQLMCHSGVRVKNLLPVPKVSDISDVHVIRTEGYVKTYSSSINPYSLGTNIPDYLSNDAHVSFDSVNKAEIDDYTKSNNLLQK